MSRSKRNQGVSKTAKRRFRRRQAPRTTIRTANYTEVFSFSVALGSSSSLTMPLLAGLPPLRPFRVRSISVVCCNAYVPPTTAIPLKPSNVPSAVSLVLCEATQYTNSSKTVVLGSTPRRCTVRAPPSNDFVYHTTSENWQFGILEAICIGAVGNGETGYIRGICYVNVQYMKEILSATCPSVNLPPAHSVYFGGATKQPLSAAHSDEASYHHLFPSTVQHRSGLLVSSASTSQPSILTPDAQMSSPPDSGFTMLSLAKE